MLEKDGKTIPYPFKRRMACMRQTDRHCIEDIRHFYQGKIPCQGYAKAGFTLMELLVYMAIVGVVVIIAGQAFSDSTKMRVRTESMMKATHTSGDVSSIFREDLSQMGAKSAMEISANPEDAFFTGAITDVYMDPNNADETLKDSSSFNIIRDNTGASCFHDQNTTNSECDRLTMRRLRYKDDGTYDAVEEISWFVENGTLKRSCKTIKGNEDMDACPEGDSVTVSIADNVESFIITPGIPNIEVDATSVLPSTSESINEFKLVSRYDEGNFEPLDFEPANGGASVKVYGFVANYDFENNTPITEPTEIRVNQAFLAEIGSDKGPWKSLCKVITLEPNTEYEISFRMPISSNDPSRMFCPGRDHMSVGFRYIDDGLKPSALSDFSFYPPTEEGNTAATGARHMRFFVQDSIKDVCLGFTFSSFSPVAASGSLNFSEVRLKKIASSSYTFNNSALSIANKKNVKAMRLQFTVKRNGEAGSSTLFIPTPSNGPRD